jgi:hypothetical protein
MRYKLEDIVTFLTVIETGGLTAAARRLGVAKSVAGINGCDHRHRSD